MKTHPRTLAFRLPALALAVAAALTVPPAGAATPAAAPRADLTVLPTLSGSSSYAFGINNAGQVVGYSYDVGYWRAFLWTPASGMRDLGGLGGNWTQAYAINDAGQVVGYSADAAGNQRAFLWTPGSGMRDLGDLGGPYSEARAINDAGQVVGYSTDAAGNQRAFLWTPGSGMRELGTLGGASDAYGINDVGQVVGSSYDAARNKRAFLWTPGSGMRDLGDLGGNWNQAHAINDAGQVVGSSYDAVGYQRAFLWTPGSGMRDLGDLGGNWSRAYAINDAGQVVGSSYDAAGNQRAFLWRDGVMTDLAGLAGLDYIPTTAGDINEYAQVTGDGTDTASGEYRNFVLTLHPDWQGSDGWWDDTTGTHWNWAGTGTAAARIGEMHDVVIDPGVSATVRGSRDGRARSLRIGGTAGQLAALDLNYGTTTVLNGTTLATGGMLKGQGRLQGDLTVQAGGRVSVAENQTMQLAGNVTNAGDVDAQAASGSIARLEVTGNLTNDAAARINLHNAEVLALGGLANGGRLNASGEVRISGAVNNQAGGRVQVSGTSADAIFWDDFVNDGTVIVTDNSTATFFGVVSGSGSFLGAGIKHFAGGVSPGASPGMLTMGGIVNYVFGDLTMELGGSATPGVDYDKIVFTSDSSVTIDSRVDLNIEWWGGFTASAGDVFDLFDWNGTLTGAFGNVLLPTLDAGLVWDITDLYTTGEIRVNAVPVPAAVWLFGSGLVGLVAVARRRRG